VSEIAPAISTRTRSAHKILFAFIIFLLKAYKFISSAIADKTKQKSSASKLYFDAETSLSRYHSALHLSCGRCLYGQRNFNVLRYYGRARRVLLLFQHAAPRMNSPSPALCLAPTDTSLRGNKNGYLFPIFAFINQLNSFYHKAFALSIPFFIFIHASFSDF